MILHIGTFGLHVFLTFGKSRFEPFVQPVAEPGETRRHRHAQRDDGGQNRRLPRLQQAEPAGQREEHKPEFPGLAEHQRRIQADRHRHPADPAQSRGNHGLENDKSDQQTQHQQRVLEDNAEIEADADGHEKPAEQQPAERLDIGGNLVPVLGLCQQQAHQEPANRQ